MIKIEHPNFIRNKYYNLYLKMITNRLLNSIPKWSSVYKEKHHIIPSSIGGTNDKTNLVNVTAREHFILHKLLSKFTSGNSYYKMLEAITAFNNNSDRQMNFTSKDYELLKIANSIASSKRNKGNTNWKHRAQMTEEFKESTSARNKNSKWMSNGNVEIFTQDIEYYLLKDFKFCRLSTYHKTPSAVKDYSQLKFQIKFLISLLDLKIGKRNRQKLIRYNYNSNNYEYLCHIINNLKMHIHYYNEDLNIKPKNIFKLKKKLVRTIAHRKILSDLAKKRTGAKSSRYGKKASAETSKNISTGLLKRTAELITQGLPPTWNKGKSMNYSEEQLQAISKTLSIKAICEHCGVECNLGNYKRWHSINCKILKQKENTLQGFLL